jgi:hypothetical protein
MTKAWKRVGGAAGVAGALIVGGVIAGSVSANAEEIPASTESSTSRAFGDGERGPRGEELTGDAAAQVETAVLAAYPGADVKRSFADPDGGYAAAITTADDERLLVLLDDTFTITGTETPPAGRGGPGGDRSEED